MMQEKTNVTALLASDYDGTLSQGGISDAVCEAICRFREAGGCFGVVTGRDYRWSYQQFAREHRFPFDFVIALNGSIAFDKDGRLLYAETLPAAGLMEPLRRFLFENVSHRVGFFFRYSRLDFDDRFPEGKWSGSRLECSPLSRISRFTEFCAANTVCDTEAQAAAGAQAIREAFPMLNPMRNGICIDIAPAGTDKGEGIARYAKLYGIDHDKIWTAGDNDNDLSMLSRYRGCAMTVSSPAARSAARHICQNIAEVISLISGAE